MMDSGSAFQILEVLHKKKLVMIEVSEANGRARRGGVSEAFLLWATVERNWSANSGEKSVEGL